MGQVQRDIHENQERLKFIQIKNIAICNSTTSADAVFLRKNIHIYISKETSDLSLAF